MSVVEMGLGRWASDERLAKITTVEGIEHIQEPLDKGQGIIMLAAHFTTLEISGRVLAQKIPPFDGVYRKNRSDFITELQRSGRERTVDVTIEKRDIKQMVRRLRSGRIVWYAPDQSYKLKGAEVIEFSACRRCTRRLHQRSRDWARPSSFPSLQSAIRTTLIQCDCYPPSKTFRPMTRPQTQSVTSKRSRKPS